MGGKRMTVEQEEAFAAEVMARKGDREWASTVAASVKEGVIAGGLDGVAVSLDRQHGRIRALIADLTSALPKPTPKKRRTKEEIAKEKAEKAKKAAEKAAADKKK